MLIADATDPTDPDPPATCTMISVSSDVTVLLLLALSGFLLGGAYSLWKTARLPAVILGLCGLLAAGGAIAWWF